MRAVSRSVRAMSTWAVVAAGMLSSCGSLAFAAGDEQFFVVDFEDLTEGTPVSTQYGSVGVTFSIEGSPGLFPIIAREGAPTVAFTGTIADGPQASGLFGLTDPIVSGDASVPNDIRMHFTPAASDVRLYVTDIEPGESVTATAYNGAVPVATQSVVGGAAGTGNGVSTLIALTAPTITSVLVDVTGPNPGTGWGLDFLSFHRPCAEAGCAPRIRVAQESAPGAGDFASHILGEVPIASALTTPASAIYAYDVPEGDSFNGFLMTPEIDVSTLFVTQTQEGYTIFLVHDCAIPNNPDGGKAETRVQFLNDADGGAIVVRDDPADLEPGTYEGVAGDSLFEARHIWDTCCTDGWAITGLECGGAAIVQFTNTDGNAKTPTIAGLNAWRVVGADGSEIALALASDRRVLLQHLPPTNCPADLNCDGVVDAADLAILLGAWTLSGAADLDATGTVDGADLAILLGEWGPC